MASPQARGGSSPSQLKEAQLSPAATAAADAGGQEQPLQASPTAGTPTKTSTARARMPLRKGKWTPEEEMYANRIILYFNQGVLNIPAGTTLRSYLSERLNCDPMRITKKFAGASCIGKQVFSPCEQSPANLEEISRCEEELRRLEQIFLDRLEQKNAVAFDLRDHTPSKEVDEKDSDWSKQGYHSAPRPSGRGRNGTSGSGERSFSHGSTAAIKKAISAPDLTQLAQMHEGRKHAVPLGEEDPYTVDDKAAGDLLLEFFRKLHEDHAASVRAAAAAKATTAEANGGNNGDGDGETAITPGTPHAHARKQRKVGFDEEATRKESSTSDDVAAAAEGAARSSYSAQEALRMSSIASIDRDSLQRMYPPIYGAHALKRRRSSEPALDRMVPVEGGSHPSWLAKYQHPQPLDEDVHNFHPQRHFS